MNESNPPSSAPPAGEWGKRMQRLILKGISLFVLVAVLGVAVWFWGSLNYVYSTGNRAGYLQKLSKKGWVIKTWEGELSMINIPGAAPEKFFFTVRSADVAQRMSARIGQRVSLTYNEHKALPGRLFGDTSYFVTGIETIAADEPETKTAS